MTAIFFNCQVITLLIHSILQISATLYPLIMKLETLNKLDIVVKLVDNRSVALIDLIELIDVRVYKTRGTDPKAQIARFSCELVSCYYIHSG